MGYGGFIYFDAAMSCVATNYLAPTANETSGLHFGRGQILPKKIVDDLTREGRFTEVTIPAFREAGAREFAWIHPNEFAEDLYSDFGCFAYKFEEGQQHRYYPVCKLNELVFTTAISNRQCTPSEAFVVVRSSTPHLEKICVFNKDLSLE